MNFVSFEMHVAELEQEKIKRYQIKQAQNNGNIRYANQQRDV